MVRAYKGWGNSVLDDSAILTKIKGFFTAEGLLPEYPASFRCYLFWACIICFFVLAVASASIGFVGQ